MREFSKQEKIQVKELLRRGILRRHAKWHDELRELLAKPYDNETGNEFDRSMMLTDRSRRFYKEAMQMEDYYRTSMLHIGLSNLLSKGYLTEEDITLLPEDILNRLQNNQVADP